MLFINLIDKCNFYSKIVIIEQILLPKLLFLIFNVDCFGLNCSSLTLLFSALALRRKKGIYLIIVYRPSKLHTVC